MFVFLAPLGAQRSWNHICTLKEFVGLWARRFYKHCALTGRLPSGVGVIQLPFARKAEPSARLRHEPLAATESTHVLPIS